MPVTDIQAEILRVIAKHRNPESYLAGATVIHRAANSPRYSQDLDFFHDVADSVASCAQQDVSTLQGSGYQVDWLLQTPSFHRALVTTQRGQLKIEWAQDSAFRFFPLLPDEWCGYRLHDADAAVNKILALAGRQEVRDFVDILHLDAGYLSIGAMAWAACGKDPGFTPDFLLDHAGRHAAYTQTDIDRLSLRQPLDLQILKKSWLAALANARTLITALPASEIGCLYLDAEKNPTTPQPSTSSFPSLIRHRGCIRGSWPTVAQVKAP